MISGRSWGTTGTRGFRAEKALELMQGSFYESQSASKSPKAMMPSGFYFA
jgi:hypothetical protein